MIVNTTFRSALYLSVSLLALSCSKGNDDEDAPLPVQDHLEIVIPSSKHQPGFGDNDSPPVGTIWALPPGIRIVQRPHHPFDPSLEKLHGSANTFYADISFVNDSTGGGPVFVEFPPGLVVVSTSEGRLQNGLNIEKFIVEVPPVQHGGGGKDTTTIYIGVACLNKNKALPWEENFEDDVFNYPIGKNMYNKYIVSTDHNLLKLLEEFKNKPKLRLTRHWDPTLIFDEGYQVPEWMQIYDTINEMIWKVTDGHGITKGDLAELRKKLQAYQ